MDVLMGDREGMVFTQHLIFIRKSSLAFSMELILMCGILLPIHLSKSNIMQMIFRERQKIKTL